MVDLTEQLVVAQECCEHRGSEARTRIAVRVQVDGELVFVERTRDDAPGHFDIVFLQGQDRRSAHHDSLLSGGATIEHPNGER